MIGRKKGGSSTWVQGKFDSHSMRKQAQEEKMILITGGNGFIGSNVLRMLVDQGRKVVSYDLSAYQQSRILTEIKGKFEVEFGDVTDLSNILRIIKKWGVKGIIHCAGLVTKRSIDSPIETLHVNVIGSANMLEAARIADLGRVIILSSSSVMGAPEDVATPRREEDICLPASGMYALTKLTCEQLVYTYRKIYKVDTLAVRPRSPFGPGVTRGSLPIVSAVEAALEGTPVDYETGGDTGFDFTYIKDLAKGIIQAFDCESPRYHVYNLSFGKNRTVSQAFDVLRRVFPQVPIKIGSGLMKGMLKKGEQIDTTYRQSLRPPQDITRAMQDFNYKPEWDLDRAIPDWVRWIKGGAY